MTLPPAVVDWLLEPDNPPVRYMTMTNLLGTPPGSPEVRKAKAGLMDYSVTRGILEMSERFSADDKDRAYWKYTGKYWQLIFLGHFLADGRDPRIAGWAVDTLRERAWVTHTGGECLTANVLASCVRLGYGRHPVVREEMEALANRVVTDGGVRCSAMAYSLLPLCHMAQPKLLSCFSLVPADQRSPAISAAIRILLKNLLDREVFVYVPGNQAEWQKILARLPKKEQLAKGETVISRVAAERGRFLQARGLGAPRPKQGWLKFGFPLHYNSDVLEAMVSLARLGVPMSPQLQRPLQAIRGKMTAEGTWILENTLNGKMFVDVEEKGKASKWLTYFGHFVLQHFA